jgi:heme exporter protein B
VRAAVGALLRKDLRTELRTFESVPAMTLFTVTTFVLFHFGLDRDTLDGDLAAGVLWVTILFAAVLGQNRLFVAEQEQGGFDGFLLAPVDRTALFVAKAVALFCYLAVVELVAVPAFAILLLGPDLLDALPELLLVLVLGTAGLAVVGTLVAVPAFAILLLGPDLLDALPELLLVLVLGTAGLAVVGTLVAGLAVRTRARELLGPLLTLPLLVPVVLAASEATGPLLAASGPGALSYRWVTVLAVYDLLFGLVAYGVFDFLLED